MTSSAPIERTRSTFDVLDTPVTCAPNALAICTANDPTPPAAPITNTFCPDRTFPTLLRPWSAVNPVVGTVAASSKLRFVGLGASRLGRAVVYSANVPTPTPNTSSPTRNPVTPSPSTSTVPATSWPRTRCFGERSPDTRRIAYGVPVMTCQSPMNALAAPTRSNTSSLPAMGTSTSSNLSTSAEPYSSCTIAFMQFPSPKRGGQPWLDRSPQPTTVMTIFPRGCPS